MKLKLFDSELKVMETLWKHGDCTAGQKGAIERCEPNFMCRAAVRREEIQAAETEELIDRMFEGSKSKFFAAFLSGQSLSKEELEELKQVLRQAGQEEA